MLAVRHTMAALVILTSACGGAEPTTARPAPPPRAAAPSASAPSTAVAPPSAPARAYPPSRTVDVVHVLHGVPVPDPYRWLEDGESDEVQAWTGAQDAFARAELAKLPERDALLKRFRELHDIERVGAPLQRGGRHFWSKKSVGQEKEAVYWRQGKAGEPKVLLDPNQWSPDGSVSLGSWLPSWDGRYVAYQVKKNNADEATLEIIDVAKGKKLPEVIEGARYADRTALAWDGRSAGIYYVKVPPLSRRISAADRPGLAEIRYHALGDDPARDRLVRQATRDPRTFLQVAASRDGRWLIATVQHGWVSTDVYLQDLRAGNSAPWKPLIQARPHMYLVEPHRDHLYVLTDDGAPNYRVFRVDPRDPGRDRWVEIVPERRDEKLDRLEIVGNRLGLVYLKDVAARLEVRELDGRPAYEVSLPGVGSVSTLRGDPEADEAYFTFESFTLPPEIHELSVPTGRTEVTYRTRVPVDTAAYTTEQVFATSKDGTRVPMFVLRGKDAPRDGTAPAVLHGYGGFSLALTPSFWSKAYPWLERGGLFAVANLRGGGEYGEAWHRAGMRHNKQNVFDDVIAAAEHLVRQGYTRPDRLVIEGRSNGGLLVGAAITQRPDLFRAALCQVPLMDMVRYHLFGSGKTWIEEYGSANDPDDFGALFSYSPYHRVRPGTAYPSLLVMSVDSDDRVDPMHARKFTAALQAASTGGPVLLRVQEKAGHGGGDRVQSTVEELADAYAFALSQIAR
ncbi:prolyl oligopeptidase family serine peptidase [Sorangium sp. So ce1024]|uniref:prolyl oligopeptidase family serine peptidase n=1 Tax=Sorangium sp. So ce1024 TaxID=3133327 RepID=UPI003F005AA5